MSVFEDVQIGDEYYSFVWNKVFVVTQHTEKGFKYYCQYPDKIVYGEVFYKCHPNTDWNRLYKKIVRQQIAH